MLSDIQKKYVEMIVLSGTKSQDDIRIFLAKSGWQIGEIDEAILYTNTEEFKAIESGQPAPASSQPEATPVTIPVKPQDDDGLHITVTEETSKENVKPLTDAKEDIANYFDTLAVKHDGLDPQKASIPKTQVDGIAPVMTMPQQVVEAPQSHKALKWIAIGLLTTLFVVVVGALGYMYYTKTGIFTEVTYIKQ